mmetsp:Transcript_58566/g.96143  ORF Transcript_58566/g.96143 Transcript_58566/m.96143 type:complete len:97 (+) Transcript_58566:576-866(+)
METVPREWGPRCMLDCSVPQILALPLNGWEEGASTQFCGPSFPKKSQGGHPQPPPLILLRYGTAVVVSDLRALDGQPSGGEVPADADDQPTAIDCW